MQTAIPPWRSAHYRNQAPDLRQQDFSGAAVDLTNFEENFVHMRRRTTPRITGRTSSQYCCLITTKTKPKPAPPLVTSWMQAPNNVWTGTANIAGNANQVNAALIQGQYRWATDYLGLHQWMVNSTEYGNDAAVHALLAP